MSALDPVKRVGAQLTEAILRHQPKLGRRGARRRAVELLREVEIPLAEKRGSTTIRTSTRAGCGSA